MVCGVGGSLCGARFGRKDVTWLEGRPLGSARAFRQRGEPAPGGSVRWHWRQCQRGLCDVEAVAPNEPALTAILHAPWDEPASPIMPNTAHWSVSALRRNVEPHRGPRIP